MEVELSLPPTTVPGGFVELATMVADLSEVQRRIALHAATSDVSLGQVNTTSGSAATVTENKAGYFNSSTMKYRMTFEPKAVTQEREATVVAPMLNVDAVTSSAGDTETASCITIHPGLLYHTTSASRGETLDLDSVTCQETKCNREFCVRDSIQHEPPRISENVAVVATVSHVSGNVNQIPSVERNLLVIPNEESVPIELPAHNSLDLISSAIIQESFEASEPSYFCSIEPPAYNHSDITQQHITTASIESRLSPCNNIAVPDTAPTLITHSILISASEHSIENVGAIASVETKDTQVPGAVTYTDATNLAAQYPEIASQILVAPLQMRTASEEVFLAAEQEYAADNLPSKRRGRRGRRPRRKRSRDDLQECQQQRDSRTPGSIALPSRQKDLNFASGSWHTQPNWSLDTASPMPIPLVERTRDSLKERSQRDLGTPVSAARPFHQKDLNFASGSWRTPQPGWSVDSAFPAPSPSVERTPFLQMNHHASATWKNVHSYRWDGRDKHWDIPAAAMWSMDKPTEAFAPPPTSHQRDTTDAHWDTPAAGMWSAEPSEALTAPPARFATLKRAPAQEQGRHHAVPSRRKERASTMNAMDPTTTYAWPHSDNANLLVTELFRKAMDTSPSATSVHYSERNYQSEGSNPAKALVPETTRPANQVEKPTDGESLRARLGAPLNLPHTPATARTEEDHAMYQIYKTTPHQHVNDSLHNATTMHTPHLHLDFPPGRHSKPYTPPSSRMIELLETSERICHLERLLARERDLLIDITGIDVPPLNQTQVLQPIGPWQGSDERGFHLRGAMNPGTRISTNQPEDLVCAMQAMGLGISARADTSTLGTTRQYDRPNVMEQSHDGLPRRGSMDGEGLAK